MTQFLLARATSFLALAALAAPAIQAAGQDGASSFDARSAEHLWNRAGFGAPPSAIERAVALGREAFVAELLAAPAEVEAPFYPDPRRSGDLGGDRERMRELSADERKEEQRRQREEEQAVLRDYLAWWVERMVRGEDPLVERMTLFWHGYFTSSMTDVKNAHEMIAQNELFRRHALGSFRELLHAVARDAAMLEYLDNDANRRGKPNENFARELLELFTLGEGNYTETDVKETARAFTGWRDQDGRFHVEPRAHDDGEKTVLGRTGRLDGDDVLEILLEEEACARHLASRLVLHFEGVAPTDARLERFARVLREHDYELRPFLEALFLDPEFEREEVVGTRISAPLDFLVASARRLEIEPPPRLLVFGAGALGQKLFFPPSVRGWEGGRAWITTASLMLRGNLAGFLVGEVSLDDFLEEDASAEELAASGEAMAPGGMDELDGPEPGDEEARNAESDSADDEAMDGAMGGEAMGSASGPGVPRERGGRRRRIEGFAELRGLERIGWRPRIHLAERLRRAGAVADGDAVGVLAEMLLGVALAPDTHASLVAFLAEERERSGAGAEDWLDDSDCAEPLLRRLAHRILSLPEAQLD
jgi:uncharacterized protein (DUF1800 family)